MSPDAVRLMCVSQELTVRHVPRGKRWSTPRLVSRWSRMFFVMAPTFSISWYLLQPMHLPMSLPPSAIKQAMGLEALIAAQPYPSAAQWAPKTIPLDMPLIHSQPAKQPTGGPSLGHLPHV